MLLKFIFLFFCLLTTSLVFAFEAPIKSEMVECNDCNPSEVETAQTMAKSKEQELKNQINSISNTKEISQETICSLNTTSYNEKCKDANGENPMDRLQTEVNQLKLQLKARITEITSANNLNSNESSGFIERIIKTFKILKFDLENKNKELIELKNICNDLSLKASNACIPPKISPEEVGTKVTAVDTVVVETKLLRTITIDAPKIIEKRNEVANSYVSLANKVHPTQTDINESLQQITKTLYALGELNFTTNPTCVEGPFGNVCDSNESEPQTTIDDDNPFSNPVEANPSLGRPVARPNQEGSSSNSQINEQESLKENPSQQKLTSEQLIGETQNKAYGVGPDIKTGPYQPKDTADTSIEPTSGNSFFGRMGNALTELSSVAPLFNKTKGGFGNDDSYGSNRMNSRYANTSNQTNLRALNPNVAYNPLTEYTNPNKNLNNKSSSIKDQGSYSHTQSNSNNPFRGNLSAGGIPMSDNSDQFQKPAKKEKPGLLSRLFSRQNQTLFSDKNKLSGGSNTSSYSQSASSNYYNENSNQSKVSPQNSSNRSFDPDKYVPTKKAQAEAYSRHTGRKIASKTSGGDINIWPKDISRNKDTNIFLKVNLTYKSNLK